MELCLIATVILLRVGRDAGFELAVGNQSFSGRRKSRNQPPLLSITPCSDQVAAMSYPNVTKVSNVRAERAWMQSRPSSRMAKWMKNASRLLSSGSSFNLGKTAR